MAMALGYFYARFTASRVSARAFRVHRIRMLEAKVSARKRTCSRCSVGFPEENAVIASTGCVLTDQIFEAARKKGIMPVDFLGPAHFEE